jgi:hypothetical protein
MVEINSIQTPVEQVQWEELIPEEQSSRYGCVLQAIREDGLEFALGGGLALSVYTGRLRNTKDLDLYIRPEHRDRLVTLLEGCGLTDYFETVPYDRNWIYRSHNNGVIVDAIWAMANQRAQVDEHWLAKGKVIRMFGEEFRVVPPEELIWSKLYVVQRDRCDWPDILNLIWAIGPELDWRHLMDRVAEDVPLIRGVLSIFSWMSPDRARAIPHWVWQSLGLTVQGHASGPEGRPARWELLDTRPWFCPAVPA